MEDRKRRRAAKVNTLKSIFEIPGKLVVDSPKAHKQAKGEFPEILCKVMGMWKISQKAEDIL